MNHRMMVLASSASAPLLGGAIIYYSLRKSHSDLANLGNICSFVSFGILLALIFGLPTVFALISPVVSFASLAGIILAIVTVMQVRRA